MYGGPVKADLSGTATAPNDNHQSDLMDDDSGIKGSSRVKQKPKTLVAVSTDKKHVNVVSVGHIDAGKYMADGHRANMQLLNSIG